MDSDAVEAVLSPDEIWQRLAALEKAFFAAWHDAQPWLDGWYPATLAMQREAVFPLLARGQMCQGQFSKSLAGLAESSNGF
jgi:hypothetical protein